MHDNNDILKLLMKRKKKKLWVHYMLNALVFNGKYILVKFFICYKSKVHKSNGLNRKFKDENDSYIKIWGDIYNLNQKKKNQKK